MQQLQPASDVFISYAGFDRELAANLATCLHAANVAAWWDALLAGDEPFERQLQRVLSETKLIIAILSRRALASEWVRWELSQASQNGLHVVPLLVQGLERKDLPPPLNLLSCLALASDEPLPAMQAVARRIDQLVQTIRRKPSEPRAADARRRLASAAATTARQAAAIKYRKTQTTPPAAIVVSDWERESHTQTAAPRYDMSPGLAPFLQAQGLALALTSAQADTLFLLGTTSSGQLVVDARAFRKPSGLHVSGGTLLVGTLAHLYRMESILPPGQRLDATYSHCFVPRQGHLTGLVDTHDVALTSRGEGVLIATRYNCLAATSNVHSFRPIWRPPFVSEIVGEDRCHLNGLALVDGSPAFVTAIARSDVYDGWREQVADGGVVLDVRTDAVVCEGLSMPHSPRLHDGRLWVLNAGAGELGFVDELASGRGRYRPVAFCSGFTRGLAFHERYAFVGVSRPRYDDFSGLVLEERLRERQEEAFCGVRVIDTLSGQCVHWFRIDGPARELYDVAVLPGVSCPRAVSPLDDEAHELITIEEVHATSPG